MSCKNMFYKFRIMCINICHTSFNCSRTLAGLVGNGKSGIMAERQYITTFYRESKFESCSPSGFAILHVLPAFLLFET